jgi:hypothetical protein
MTVATIIEFDGPAAAYCFGRTYDTLTSVGIKRAGQPYPAQGAESEHQARDKFAVELAAYKHGAQQLAWRRRPEAVCVKGMWYITARLAAYP